LIQSTRKAVSKFEVPKTQSGIKSLLKLTWSEKITVLSTFLESSLNLLSNDIRNPTKLSTVRKKSGVKV